ncbi:hypothetical protein Tco_0708467 [Tanacetum coccineum]
MIPMTLRLVFSPWRGVTLYVLTEEPAAKPEELELEHALHHSPPHEKRLVLESCLSKSRTLKLSNPPSVSLTRLLYGESRSIMSTIR